MHVRCQSIALNGCAMTGGSSHRRGAIFLPDFAGTFSSLLDADRGSFLTGEGRLAQRIL